MKLRLFLAVALLASGAAADEARERLDELAARFALPHRATFHQTYLPAGMSFGEEVDGRVWLAGPANIRFDEGEPLLRATGLEGRELRLLDLEAQSCDDHVLGEQEWSQMPLALVLDPEAALLSFAPRLEDGVLILEAVESAGIDRLELHLDAHGLPSELVTIDPQGARNRFEFTDWQPGEAPPSGWLPEVPTGIECLRVDD